jgi:hypothetical protein
LVVLLAPVWHGAGAAPATIAGQRQAAPLVVQGAMSKESVPHMAVGGVAMNGGAFGSLGLNAHLVHT